MSYDIGKVNGFMEERQGTVEMAALYCDSKAHVVTIYSNMPLEGYSPCGDLYKKDINLDSISDDQRNKFMQFAFSHALGSQPISHTDLERDVLSVPTGRAYAFVKSAEFKRMALSDYVGDQFQEEVADGMLEFSEQFPPEMSIVHELSHRQGYRKLERIATILGKKRLARYDYDMLDETYAKWMDLRYLKENHPPEFAERRLEWSRDEAQSALSYFFAGRFFDLPPHIKASELVLKIEGNARMDREMDKVCRRGNLVSTDDEPTYHSTSRWKIRKDELSALFWRCFRPLLGVG